MYEIVKFYKENIKILVEMFELLGFKIFGGKNVFYVWV